MLKFIIALLLFTFFDSFNAMAQLSKTEKKMIRYIDEHNEEAMDLLIEVVNINSGSLNLEGVYRVGQIFMAKLDALGMETKWVDGKGFNRSGHLIAKKEGSGPRLLLIGHLDTVFERESPFQEFKYLNDSIGHGPGVADMKGGDVVIIQALSALKEVGLLDKMNITVVMTGDEESTGRPLDLAREDLVEAAKEADISLGFENGDGDPTTALISRRGAEGWEVSVNGKPAHSSQVFSETIGTGAIFEASRILNRFYEELSPEPHLTFNPGLVLAGTSFDYYKTEAGGRAFGKNNIVAEHAFVTGDLRAISPEQVAQTKATMQKIIWDG